jgi:phosphatidylglycerol---prolipoprotein diacylglyceryl transferase
MLDEVSIFFQAAMILVPGQLRLGPMRLSGYGLCAAVGLMAALWLTQRTARLVGLAAERVWDASLFAVMAAFVVSRVLLIAGEPRAFARYPVLVLGLPSFTDAGMALTALAVLAYLRWKRLPLLRLLDAWAPCAAVLAAALSVGRFVEGTSEGMPTRLPWGTVAPGSSGLVRLQPVGIYAAVASLVLLGVLLWVLERGRTSGAKAPFSDEAVRPEAEASGYLSGGRDMNADVEGLGRLRGGGDGRVAAWGLVVGGGLVFGLDMLSQPGMVSDTAWLEPGQWVALGVMGVGVVMLLILKEIV